VTFPCNTYWLHQYRPNNPPPQKLPDSRLHQSVTYRPSLLAGLCCSVLALAAPLAYAGASDIPELTLSTSLDLAHKDHQNAPGYENNSAARDEVNFDATNLSQFQISLTLLDKLDLPIPENKIPENKTVPAQAISYKNEAASIVVASATIPVKTVLPAPIAIAPPSLPATENLPLTQNTELMSLSTAIDYKSGKYGGTYLLNTQTLSITAKYETPKWAFNLTIPRIHFSAQGSYFDLNTGTTVNERSTQSGLGDIATLATYHAYVSQDATAGFDLTGRIKFGTADPKKYLGTGKNDYIAQVSGYVSAGKLIPFGVIGYQKSGQPPGLSSETQLHNVFLGTLGADYIQDESSWLEVMFYMRERLANLYGPQREISLSFNHNFNNNWYLQSYLLKGFANGSPDFGTGATLSYSLNP